SNSGRHGEPTAQEGEFQEGQLHHERAGRRSRDREKGQKRCRAATVLYRPRPHALRSGRFHSGEEIGFRLPEHSEECSPARSLKGAIWLLIPRLEKRRAASPAALPF